MNSAYPQNQAWNPYGIQPQTNAYFQQNFPQNYQNPIPQPTQNSGSVDGVAFVQGENAALAYVVPAGKTWLLMDTVEDRIYFKSADIYGRPSPLNDFWLTKTKPEAPAPVEEPPAPQYATLEDLNALKEEIELLKAKKTAGRPRKAEETEVEE